MQHSGVRAKTDWLGIRIVCPIGATCLPADSCFSEQPLQKSNSSCWSSIKQTSLTSHQNVTCSRHEKNSELALNNNHSLTAYSTCSVLMGTYNSI
jgi:hypothetical protein